MKAKLLSNKVAIVTGGSEGIGFAITQLFAQEGAKVVFTGRHQDKLDKAQSVLREQGLGTYPVQADVAKAEDTNKVFNQAQKLGDLDILVNNAGISDEYAIDETSDDWVKHVLAINLEGPIRYSREALRVMMPKDQGVIINISSVNGVEPIGGAAYTASKGGVNTLTKNMAIRLSDTNIRVNAIAPGATVTPMHLRHLKGENPGGNLMLEYGKKYCNWDLPATEPIDQANAALFLASSMGKGVRGQVIQVDNGAFL